MKKIQLLFLVLSSAFFLKIETYASESLTQKKIKTKIANNGKIEGEIEVTYHKEDPEILYDNVTFADAGIYIFDTDKARGKYKNGAGEHNMPFIPGIKGAPKGYKIVTLWFPVDQDGSEEGSFGKFNPDFEKAVIQTENISDFKQPSGYTMNDKYMWMLMSDENNEIFIGTLEKDENADDFYGGQMYDANRKKADIDFVRKFKIPNKDATEKYQEVKRKLSEFEKKIESGELGASSSNKSAITTTDHPFFEKFQFGDGQVNGRSVHLVLATSDPKATPENFAELKKDLLQTCSKHPNVAYAIFSLALDNESEKEERAKNLKAIRLVNKGLYATLTFSSEVDPELANAYIEKLKERSTLSPEDIKQLKETHIEKIVEYEKEIKDLEEEKFKIKEALENAEKEKKIAAKIAAQALDEVDQETIFKEQIDQIMEKLKEENKQLKARNEVVENELEAIKIKLKNTHQEMIDRARQVTNNNQIQTNNDLNNGTAITATSVLSLPINDQIDKAEQINESSRIVEDRSFIVDDNSKNQENFMPEQYLNVQSDKS